MQQAIQQLYHAAAIREIESWVSASGVCTHAQLVERAGTAALQVLRSNWPDAAVIGVVCGAGNNAADGYSLAKLALATGYEVKVMTLAPMDQMKTLASECASAAMEAGVSITAFDAADELPAVDLWVDAILGIGQSRPLSDGYASVVAALNAHAAPIMAIDVPTGVNADTGQTWGEAIFAALTITYLLPKSGLVTAQGLAQAGHVVFDDLDIHPPPLDAVQPVARCLQWEQVAQQLPRRQRNVHKGSFGHVLVIGGDYGMGGAVRLAAEGALRIGAGLVTVATRPEHVAVVTGARPELMCTQVSDASDLTPCLSRANVVVIGPGLGQSSWGRMLLDAVLAHDLPCVIDADALNLLAKTPIKRDNWLLTPHPGEAGRLLDCACDAVQQDRFHTVDQLQKQYGGVVVLKGAGTLIAAQNRLPAVCTAGNPGMATGGMGDILTGVLGGLLAQGLSLSDAASVGVLLHAHAADIAAGEEGERGLMATDVLYYMRQLANPASDDDQGSRVP